MGLLGLYRVSCLVRVRHSDLRLDLKKTSPAMSKLATNLYQCQTITLETTRGTIFSVRVLRKVFPAMELQAYLRVIAQSRRKIIRFFWSTYLIVGAFPARCVRNIYLFFCISRNLKVRKKCKLARHCFWLSFWMKRGVPHDAPLDADSFSVRSFVCELLQLFWQVSQQDSICQTVVFVYCSLLV